MSESQVLKQKTDELQAAVAEAQQELARADASRRSEAHTRLAGLVDEARKWLEGSSGRSHEGEAAAAEARKAEGYVHDIRMQRANL